MISCGWKIKQDEYKQDDEMQTQDVTQEMKDLMAVYEHAYLDAHTQAEVRLDSLVHYMKAFIEAHEAKSEFAGKLDNLRDKLGMNQCNDCDEGEEC